MDENHQHWYEVKDIGKVDSPALLVYPERVLHNIRLAVKMAGDTSRLRPHIKTVKSSGAAMMMIAEGIHKFKCATISEAEMLGQCGAKDVLLAYQPLGPKLDRFIALVRKFPNTRFSCLTDNMKAAGEQSSAFESQDLVVPVFIDLNVGMNRTGITAGEEALSLYSYCNSLKGLQPTGLHAYDGHIRESDFSKKRSLCDAAFQSVQSLRKKIEETGIKVPLVIAGGSPTFSIHCNRSDVECSPGTFAYWDKGYSDLCREQDFLHAAVLITRVISVIFPDRICTDLGHKSVAAENTIDKRIFFPEWQQLRPVSQSEEHLVLEATGRERFDTGTLLYGIPYHICPTVALYERVYTVENGLIKGEWKNEARDRKLTV